MGELTGGVTAAEGCPVDPGTVDPGLIRSNPDNDGKVLLVDGGPGGPVGNK